MTEPYESLRDCGPMDYQLSVPVPASLYENDAYPSRFRPRISRHTDVADEACWEACDDFENATGKKLNPDSIGCINPISGNVNALWFPEALPERLRIISYLSELLFRHDDLTDEAQTAEQFDDVHGPLARFLGSESKRSDHTTKHNAMNTMQARIAIEALEQDERLGKLVIEKWKGIITVRGQDAFMEHQTLDSYMHIRHYDAGAYSVWSQMLFVSDMTLSDEDLTVLEPLTWLAFTHMILWHDYSSWDKEAATYHEREEGGSNLSAVLVYMTMYDLDQQAAKKFLLTELERIEDEYCERKDEYVSAHSPSQHILRYIGLIEMVMAGNTLWHLTSRRYTTSTPLPKREDIGKVNGCLINLEEIERTEGNDGDVAAEEETVGAFSEAGDILTPCCSSSADRRPLKQAFWHGQKTEYTTMKPAELGSGPRKTKHNKETALTVQPCVWPTEKDEKTILAPYIYTSSRPASGARDKLIDALNNWYSVPSEALATIRSIVTLIHNASLMLDDIQDSSPTRRGAPSAHVVFGTSQTANSASYIMVKSMQIAGKLSPEAVSSFLSELSQLHLGQSHDLKWTYHCKAPTMSEYYNHLEQKTGGLFRMASRMMQIEATRNKDLDLNVLMSLLGRLYQLRDDYEDTAPGNVAEHGDVDEGGFTLPLIHALQVEEEAGGMELASILQSARHGTLSIDTKQRVSEKLEEAGSLEFTRATMVTLYSDVKGALTRAEEATGKKNWILRLAIFQLKI